MYIWYKSCMLSLLNDLLFSFFPILPQLLPYVPRPHSKQLAMCLSAFFFMLIDQYVNYANTIT